MDDLRNDWDKPVVRLLKLLIELAGSSRPRSRSDLAGKIGVSRKTIGRYVVDLELAGLPIEEERRGKASYYRLRPHKLPMFPQPRLT